jgi:hypothetical protein
MGHCRPVPQALGGLEAEIEAALLVEVAKESSKSKPKPLLWHQPVKLAGLPFQFPLPLSARGNPKVPGGNSAGHADVIAKARTAGKERVRIFELKKKGANDVDHALDQAVAYCAALDHLLRNYPTTYCPALGFGAPRKNLPLDAVAFVPDSKANRRLVRIGAERLADGDSPFGLCAMFFRPGRQPRDRRRCTLFIAVKRCGDISGTNKRS